MKTKFYPGAPASNDKQVVDQLFRHYCNCYSYAVQDYFAGYLTGLSGAERLSGDGSYLPRPGQTRGKSYSDLLGKNIRGMRRAVCEDGLLFAGEKYPKHVPDDKYVICCFLEPDQYHFIRQNQDGSWSSKNGLEPVSVMDLDDKNPLTNPEDFYRGDPQYTFVGYFLVPKGGIHVGIRGYEEKKLAELEKRPSKIPAKIALKEFLSRSVQMTLESDELKKQALMMCKTAPKELLAIWNNYVQDMNAFSMFQKRVNIKRRSLLQDGRTRGKKMER